MALLDKIYAGTEGLDDPDAILGGMQSMPDHTGGSVLQNDLGQRLGSIRGGVIEGQDTIHGEHGGFEGTVEESPLGGKTYFDENMQPVMHTKEGGMGHETIYSSDGVQIGTVQPNGMGGEVLSDSMGNEIASSSESITGHDIEAGAQPPDIGGADGMAGMDLSAPGDAVEGVGGEDVGDLGDLGDAGDVADLDGLSEVGDLGDIV